MKIEKRKRIIVNAGMIGALISMLCINMTYEKSNVEEVPLISSKEAYEVIVTEIEKMEPVEEVVIEPVVSMDFVEPRQDITDEFDVLKPSNITKDDLVQALDDKYRSGLIPIVDHVLEAEETYGVNALYLISTLALESGWGKYQTGANNIAGWKTLSGGWRDFESVNECVMTVAKGLATSFKDDVGSLLIDVTGRYCTDLNYLDNVKSIMSYIENKIY